LNLSDKKNIIFSISVEWLKPIALEFRKDYLKNYGKMLGAIAAYACDGVNLIIEAILKAGLDYQNIQKSLSKIHHEGELAASVSTKMEIGCIS